jgi:hypothetical protein
MESPDRLNYLKTYSKEYYQKNKEKLKAIRKEYLEQEKEQGRKYLLKHKDLNAKARYEKFVKKHGKERINLLHKNNYHNNPLAKNKMLSRIIRIAITHELKIFIPLKCNGCGTYSNLQIHHTYYPLTIEETLDAIDKEKIVFLCKECHLTLHKLNAPLLL